MTLPLLVTAALLVLAAVFDRHGGYRAFVMTAAVALGLVAVFAFIIL